MKSSCQSRGEGEKYWVYFDYEVNNTRCAISSATIHIAAGNYLSFLFFPFQLLLYLEAG